MIFKKYISNVFKKMTPVKKTSASIYLDMNITRFTYFSCAVSGRNIEIIKSNDTFGGYYDQKLILPSEISTSMHKRLNHIHYIYKILFLLVASKSSFYLPENKKNLDYIFLSSILSVKTINRYLCNEYPNIKNIIKTVYKDILQLRPKLDNLSGRALVIEIIMRKVMYQNIRGHISLNRKEKLFIYHVENISRVNSENFASIIKETYKKLCDIYSDYKSVELNQLWGYFYYKENRKIQFSLKSKMKNRRFKHDVDLKKHMVAKDIKTTTSDHKKNNLNSLFDYKQTTDNYQDQKNKHFDDQSSGDIDVIKDLNASHVMRDTSSMKSSFTLNVINSLILNNTDKVLDKTKKFSYREWNHGDKKYLYNWCNVFEKKENGDYITKNEKILANKRLDEYKHEINQFKEKFKFIMNKKTWIKRQLNGEDIDLDTIIDNYKYIRENNFNKIYKYKKNTQKDLCITILFDSSLSTDSYINNNKTLDFLKNLTLVLASGLADSVKKFSVATFYSNTRHDCRYIILKDFDDTWNKNKYTLEKTTSNGYTRIGPAIRHATYQLKKFNIKQKIIILLSDGKPTDYDEYEGVYGINDVKHSIDEAIREKIHVKSIIVDPSSIQYLQKMFGFNNYHLIPERKKINTKLIELFTSLKS